MCRRFSQKTNRRIWFVCHEEKKSNQNKFVFWEILWRANLLLTFRTRLASPLRQTGLDKLPHFTGCFFEASLLSPPSGNYSFQSRYREIHGSGKSSLISALLGEMKTLSGVANTRGKIAYVPQQAKFSIHKLSIQNQLHCVANVYAVLPVSTVKCLCSRGQEWGREGSHSHSH